MKEEEVSIVQLIREGITFYGLGSDSHVYILIGTLEGDCRVQNWFKYQL